MLLKIRCSVVVLILSLSMLVSCYDSDQGLIDCRNNKAVVHGTDFLRVNASLDVTIIETSIVPHPGEFHQGSTVFVGGSGYDTGLEPGPLSGIYHGSGCNSFTYPGQLALDGSEMYWTCVMPEFQGVLRLRFVEVDDPSQYSVVLGTSGYVEGTYTAPGELYELTYYDIRPGDLNCSDGWGE